MSSYKLLSTLYVIAHGDYYIVILVLIGFVK